MCETYDGDRDAQGRPHGFGKVRMLLVECCIEMSRGGEEGVRWLGCMYRPCAACFAAFTELTFALIPPPLPPSFPPFLYPVVQQCIFASGELRACM